ncbi:sporulation protein SsgA [Amycolatopsis mediterranei]|uniref:SsgA family sporulation/cell division regulator n=1 Tax=Amycolatopsis mediterranei TaxID=33910 RepID=UPI0004A0B0EF|nr:SsgA family sporulation/cell division regulator [Amycolatopsis mediterranei]KDO11015.1 sporulation protein SsgA [Amycolatopsis mediterranei]
MELIYPADAVVNGRGPVPVALLYDPADPWAVTLLIAGHEWLFARELLATGLSEPAGDGDVVVRPDTGGTFGHLLLTLTTPAGCADVALPRGTVESLLAAAEALVPRGCEGIDWDSEWARLANGPAA